MSSPVPRTCTELATDRDPSIIFSEPKPLSAFRQSQALVLLGDAGSGKTTELHKESEALGSAAVYLSARQFARSDVDSHPDWRNMVLFIDGLDEMRAGRTDSLTPMDQIITKLEQLGRPGFRLSCREADWLGTNDRQNLSTVSPDSQITVLRLDPLDVDAIIALLNSLDSSRDAQDFINRARERGLGAVLRNPQTLTLLAKAVGQGGVWPKSRQETFELACREMAAEQNEDHLERAEHMPSDVAMEAAGYLCALQLLAGTEGYSLTPLLDDALFPSVDDLQEPPDQLSRSSLKRTLGTRLFSGVDERRVRPVHRHVAEFLGGRYLAKLTRDGLPASRAMSLMTSPSDKRVVTVLRGLSAWLAVHSREACPLLMKADPVGVGLYGDIEGLLPDEKMHLLESLVEFAKQDQLFGHERPDDRRGLYGGSTPQAFRSLASSEMVPTLRKLFTKPTASSHDIRVLEFALMLLSVAHKSELNSLGRLAPDLELIFNDEDQLTKVKVLALEAFSRLIPGIDKPHRVLKELLDAIHIGQVLDPDGQMTGTLLEFLYPTTISPAEVWRFISSNRGHNEHGRFWSFWDRTLVERSSDKQCVELLDSLGDYPGVVARLAIFRLEDVPARLLARCLSTADSQIESSRLHDWLTMASMPNGRKPGQFGWDLDVVNWLNSHPEVQKELVLVWLRDRHSDDSAEFVDHGHCHALHGTKPPSDFGGWCLDKAIEIVDAEPVVGQALLWQSYHSLGEPALSEGLTIETVQDRVRGHQALADFLDELGKSTPRGKKTGDFELERRSWVAEYRETQRQQAAKRAEQLRSLQVKLEENRAPLPILDDLAKAYFALVKGANHGATPIHRVSEYIGGDPNLTDAVLKALRGAIWRDDLPEADETVSLSLESKRSHLAYPVLACLELLHDQDPTLLDGFEGALRRKALAIHYCTPPPLRHQAASPCHNRWAQQDPDMVLDVLCRCALSALRAGANFIPGLVDLDNMSRNERHPGLANAVRHRLLESFPARAPGNQLKVLDRLLGETLKYDATQLDALATKKLAQTSLTVAQQVRWHAVGAIAAPSKFLDPLLKFIGSSERRIRHLAEFFHNTPGDNYADTSILGSSPNPDVLREFVKLLEPTCGSQSDFGFVTLETATSNRIAGWIAALGAMGSEEAKEALSELIDDPLLANRREQLTRALERHPVSLRDATYKHPAIEQVQRTLDNGLPANASDLSALLNDHLDGIADDIRGSSNNIWRQFWNEQPELTAKDEDACRDALLTLVQARLPSEVDAAREGHYVSDKRADIRVSYGGYNVPVEIKKDSHRDLWSALQEQLIEQYTTDPKNSGHGNYLVLWTGGDKISRRPDGNHPATPDELRELLEGDLTQEQAGKISVRVLDVTKP